MAAGGTSVLRHLRCCVGALIAASLAIPGWCGAAAPSTATSLTAFDLDEDGLPDLVGGFMDESRSKPSLRWLPSAANQAVRILELPMHPDFLVAGDFDADGHGDLALAERHGAGILVVAGDGKGNLVPGKTLLQDHRIEALLAADVNRCDGLADLVLSATGPRGPALIVLESPVGASRAEAEELPLPRAATALAVGRWSDTPYVDVAAASARELHLLRGRDRRLGMDTLALVPPPPAIVDVVELPGPAAALLAGRFGRGNGEAQDLLALSGDGTLSILDPGSDRLRALSSLALQPPLVLAKLTSAAGDQVLARLRSGGEWSVLSGAPGADADAWSAFPARGLDAGVEAVLPLPGTDRGLDRIVSWPDRDRAPAAALTAVLASFVVNTTNDTPDGSPGDGICLDSAGFCSLRGAIQESNALSGADAIVFNIGAGTPTITLAGPLPPITDTVSILGSTGGATRVEINGNGAGIGAIGLRLASQGIGTSGGSLIQALVLNRFRGPGIAIETASNRIEASFVGTDANGMGSVPGNGEGIVILGSAAVGNTIGGTTATLRNVISGNLGAGVRLDAGADSNNLGGNFVGVTATGLPLPNGAPGVLIAGGAHATRIGGAVTLQGTPPGNVISGNGGGGVVIASPGSTANLVQGNLIGLAPDGSTPLGNLLDGVRIRQGAAVNTIGGSAVSLRNIISANGPDPSADGIEINGASFNAVRGNYVGLDASGSNPRGNAGDGIAIVDQDGPATGNVIGGAMPPSGMTSLLADTPTSNTTSSNGGSGVKVSGSGSTSNTVASNNAGTNSSGVVTIVPGNLEHAILIELGASGNVIGGTVGVTPGGCTGACNRVAHSDGSGVVVRDPDSQRNTIRGNMIASNGALGIDLGADGVTQNDPGDLDFGPNQLQNFPVVVSAFFDGIATQIDGRLDSAPDTSYDIEIFSNTVADPSGFGEGRTFLGAVPVVTGPTGAASFHFNAPGQPTLLSATATDPNGNTSELGPTFANPGEARQLLQSKGAGSVVNVTYVPACAASDHAIYWGFTPFTGNVAWVGVACGAGVSGTASFDPGSVPLGKVLYSVVVGQSASFEGSYGNNRPEAIFPAPCERPQRLTVVCP